MLPGWPQFSKENGPVEGLILLLIRYPDQPELVLVAKVTGG